jgi:hypothetical protein
MVCLLFVFYLAFPTVLIGRALADTTPSLLDPIGPWLMESFLKLPDCSTKVSFSTNHDKANISVSHILKIMLRVERGDDEFLDSKGKRKVRSSLAVLRLP